MNLIQPNPTHSWVKPSRIEKKNLTQKKKEKNLANPFQPTIQTNALSQKSTSNPSNITPPTHTPNLEEK